MTASQILHELILFAAVGFLIGGIDDALVDLVWICRSFWRRLAVYSRYNRATVASLYIPPDPPPLAIFIPAWDEAGVIHGMLKNCLNIWPYVSYQIFVGCYQNDVPTQAAVAQIRHPRVRLVLVPRDGPTTKSDCLNEIWIDMVAEERRRGRPFAAVVLHDAEDLVHPDELDLYWGLIDRFALIQIPVLPLVNKASPWIAGHYLDEFAEAHGKAMVVREAMGAALPSAGVGCAIRRDALGWLAERHGDLPFGSDSLTEDYELGLRLGGSGLRTAFVRLLARDGNGPVAVRAYFPATLGAAVRQKSRWVVGIALSGWSRLGWDGGLFEIWMRARDRRAVLAAIVIFVGYIAALLTTMCVIANWPLPEIGPVLRTILIANAVLLTIRLAMRALFVTRAYGWGQGLYAIPRAIISNIVAIMAAYRAVFLYVRLQFTGQIQWAKTDHDFPDLNPDGRG